MTNEITNFISACNWDSVRFLFISNNVFDPLIYYSHLLPLTASLILGIFLFIKTGKQFVTKILFITILLLSAWLFGDLVIWATNMPSVTMYVWSLTIMLEPMIYAGILYFIYLFIDEMDISFSKKLAIVLLLLPTIIFTSTKFAILGYNISNCDRDAIQGPMVYYGFFVEGIFIFWILCLSIKRFVEKKDSLIRKKIFLVTAGSLGFLIAFAFGNVIGSWFNDNSIGGEYSWTIGQYGIFGIPVFVTFLTYLIVKYKSFNVKVFGAQALVTGLVILIGSEFFFVKTIVNEILVAVTFVLVFIAGYFLIKSVGSEIKQREEIEELSKQKSEFMSFAAHEIRNPLTSMKGYAANMLDGDYGAMTSELKDPVQKILVRGNDVVNLISQYLDKSKIELGQLTYHFADVDIGYLVSGVVSSFQPHADQAGVSLRYNAPVGEDFSIQGDEGKLKEVIGNIVDNSIKYAPKGAVEVSVSKKDGKVLIKIADNGVGIKAEVIPKLFKKFSRADAQQANILGTGLGLFLANEFVTAHKGRIWVESEGEGKGSQFYVELPVRG